MGGLGRCNQTGAISNQWQLFRSCTLIGDSLMGNGVRNLVCTGIKSDQSLEVWSKKLCELSVATAYVNSKSIIEGYLGKMCSQFWRVLWTKAGIGSTTLLKLVANGSSLI